MIAFSSWLTSLPLLVVLTTGSGAAALRFSVTNLNTLFNLQPDAQHTPIISNMNNAGEFLHATSFTPLEGGTAQATEAFVEHRDGTRTRFAIPYPTGIFAEFRLNNRGEVAAILHPDKNSIETEVWTYSATGVPTKVAFSTSLENLGFNDRGQISVSNKDEDRAFRYTPGVGWENLGSLSNDGFAVPRGINNAGAVVGGTSLGASNSTTPFLYRDGSGMENIPAPFGLGRAINDNFVITGDGGFVWYANEMRMDYIFNNQAYGFIRPNDINGMNQIIGAASGGSSSTGFLWDDVNGYQILTNILEDPLAWSVEQAYAINEDGWILASGYRGRGVNLPDREYAYLLLRPVPEPGMAALLLCSGIFCIQRRRRRG